MRMSPLPSCVARRTARKPTASAWSWPWPSSCLKELPDDQRMATVLSDVEGYDYQEIATITRVSLGTVKSRISRARAKLRDCLQTLSGELLPAAYRLDSKET